MNILGVGIKHTIPPRVQVLLAIHINTYLVLHNTSWNLCTIHPAIGRLIARSVGNHKEITQSDKSTGPMHSMRIQGGHQHRHSNHLLPSHSIK